MATPVLLPDNLFSGLPELASWHLVLGHLRRLCGRPPSPPGARARGRASTLPRPRARVVLATGSLLTRAISFEAQHVWWS